METKQHNYRLDENYEAALLRLMEPIPNVKRGETETIRAAIRSEWQRVFPGVPFPGDDK